MHKIIGTIEVTQNSKTYECVMFQDEDNTLGFIFNHDNYYFEQQYINK